MDTKRYTTIHMTELDFGFALRTLLTAKKRVVFQNCTRAFHIDVENSTVAES